MKTKLFAANFIPILAQASSGDLAGGASKALGIVMLIGFIFGTICVIGGGFAIRRGDTDAGKLSIIGGLIIAGAPVIVKALFTAFGIDSSTVDVGAFVVVITLLLLCSVWHWNLLSAVVPAVIPLGLALLYALAFRQGKPSGYDIDLFELWLKGSGFGPEILRVKAPPLFSSNDDV